MSINKEKQRHPYAKRCRLGLVSVPSIAWFILSLHYLASQHNSTIETIESSTSPWLLSSEDPVAPGGRLLYVGQFGLGHRLSKLAAAVDLARQVPLRRVEVYFGHCKAENKTKEWDIFRYLFGTNMIDLDRPELRLHEPTGAHQMDSHPVSSEPSSNMARHEEKIILIRNDVRGYYAGQAYKNARGRLPRDYVVGAVSPRLRLPPAWEDKLEFDVLLFRHLMRLFTHKFADGYDAFRQTLGDQFVIGLHVRAGNGETHHFAETNRGVNGNNDNEMALQSFTERLLDLIEQAKPQLLQSHGYTKDHPFVIFLATDTPQIIPLVMEAAQRFGIPVVTFPQLRVRPHAGVSYAAWTEGQQCLEGWKASVMDMALLALRADVVVAAMRSTFTQIVPLTLQFGAPEAHSKKRNKNPSVRFCEVTGDTRTIVCFASRTAWLLRQGDVFSFSLGNNSAMATLVAKPGTHKVMVHLPDVLDHDTLSDFESNLEKLRSFLQKPSHEQYFVYGDRFNSKYRSKKVTFQEDWA